MSGREYPRRTPQARRILQSPRKCRNAARRFCVPRKKIFPAGTETSPAAGPCTYACRKIARKAQNASLTYRGASAYRLLPRCSRRCAGNGQGLDSNGQPIASGQRTRQAPDGRVPVDPGQRVHADLRALPQRRVGAPKACSWMPPTAMPCSWACRARKCRRCERVKAGDPDSSYLVQKLEGSSGIVGRAHALWRTVPAAGDDRRHPPVDHQRRAAGLAARPPPRPRSGSPPPPRRTEARMAAPPAQIAGGVQPRGRPLAGQRHHGVPGAPDCAGRRARARSGHVPARARQPRGSAAARRPRR